MRLTTNRVVTVTVRGIPLPEGDDVAHAHCEWVNGNDGTMVISSGPYISCGVVAQYRVRQEDSSDDEDHDWLDVCAGHVSEASQVGA